MVGNILYSSSSLSQAYALNPKTGEVLWTYNPESYAAGSPPNLGYINRGVAYWQDGDVRRVFLATGDSRLIALDADTGNPVTSWAQQGEVNLRDGLGRSVSNRYYGVNSPPLVCGDFVIVGSSILDYPAADAMPPGDVRAFDARTGELQWQFHSIPHEDEKGAETWEQRSNERFGGVNVWTSMSCDEALRVVYLPFSTPTNDYYGGGRPGDNLYAESLVAVDMATGELRWHYQCVHHGIWDYDLPAAPNLVDTPSGSRLVAQVSKQGFVYVFDRETGTPVWPMNETAVEASGVPGEVSAMTQPIPTKPAPFELQGVTLADLNSLTPGLEQAARDAVQGYDTGTALFATNRAWSLGRSRHRRRRFLVWRGLSAGARIPVCPLGDSAVHPRGATSVDHGGLGGCTASGAIPIGWIAPGQAPLRAYHCHRHDDR